MQLPKIRLNYNKSYVVEGSSKEFIPDMSLEIFSKDNEMIAIYIFDSKFKIQISNKDEKANLFLFSWFTKTNKLWKFLMLNMK